MPAAATATRRYVRQAGTGAVRLDHHSAARPNSCTTGFPTPPRCSARLAERPARVGLDTEFIRERTYWPQLALVQMAIGRRHEILLVDPLVPGMCDALAPLLADPAVLKVMHSASEDLVAFKRACGVVPAPLFDTQIAAALAGIGARHGLPETGAGTPRRRAGQGRDPLGLAAPPAVAGAAGIRRRRRAAPRSRCTRPATQLRRAAAPRLAGRGRRAHCWRNAARRRRRTLAAPVAAQRAVPRCRRPAPPAAPAALARRLRARAATARAAGSSTTNWPSPSPAAPPADRAGAADSNSTPRPKAPRKLGDALWQALQHAAGGRSRRAAGARPRTATRPRCASCRTPCPHAAPNSACPTACSPRVAGWRPCSTATTGPAPSPAGVAPSWNRAWRRCWRLAAVRRASV